MKQKKRRARLGSKKYSSRLHTKDITVVLLLFLFLATVYFLGQQATGLFIGDENWLSHSYPVDLSLKDGSQQLFVINSSLDSFSIRSVKLTGRIVGSGDASIYLVMNGTKYLLVDRENLAQNLSDVTASAVDVPSEVGLPAVDFDEPEEVEEQVDDDESNQEDTLEESTQEETDETDEDAAADVTDPDSSESETEDEEALEESDVDDANSGSESDDSIDQGDENSDADDDSQEVGLPVIDFGDEELDDEKIDNEQVENEIEEVVEDSNVTESDADVIGSDGTNDTNATIPDESVGEHSDELLEELTNETSKINETAIVEPPQESEEDLVEQNATESVADENLTQSDNTTSPDLTSSLDFTKACVDTCLILSDHAATNFTILIEAQEGVEVDISQVWYAIEEIIVNKSEEFDFEVDITDADGDIVEAFVEFSDSETHEIKETVESRIPGTSIAGLLGNPPKSIDTKIEQGTYDIKVLPKETPVKQIEIHDTPIEEDVTEFINIDDVPETGEFEQFEEIYAIDPTKFNFTTATVTVTATGTQLHKCEDWNFTTQTCFGEWFVFKDGLIPGENYTFTLTPKDPGFGEIINITNATHLDENRTLIEEIYELVRDRDDIWTDSIPANHYIRVNFEKNLTSENDITVYARSNHSNSSIEVYEKDMNEKLADFGEITEDKKYQIFLTNLSGTQDTFDLKVTGNPIEFDHITDPDVTDCQSIALSGTYTLTQDIDTTGICFTIEVDDVILDGAGYSMSGDNTGQGVTSSLLGRTNITIKNFRNISGFTPPIDLTAMSNSFVFNNTITPTSSSGYGINFFNSSNHNNISNNTFFMSEANGGGITIEETSEHNIIDRNSFHALANSRGIFLRSGDWNNITHNTFFTDGNFAPIELVANYSHIISNSMNSTSSNGRAISLGSGTSFHNLSYNNFSSNLEGVRIFHGKHNSFYRNRIHGQDGGMSLRNYRGLNTTFTEDTIVQSTGTDINVSDANFTFINVSFDETDVAFNSFFFIGDSGVLTTKWYVDINVTNTVKDSLQSANVTSFNISILSEDATTTASDGTTRHVLTEYEQDTNGFRYSTPHTINVSLAGYNDNSTTYNLSLINNSFVNIELLDVTPPDSVTNLANQTVDATWIYWNWTNPSNSDFNQNIIFIDGVNVANTSNNFYNATGLSGTHTITLHTKDTTGNINDTDVNDSATVTVITIAPNVTALLPVGGTEFNTSVVIEIAANVTSTNPIDTVLANVTYPNGTIEQLNLTNGTGHANKFNLSFTIPQVAGQFNITFIANDTQGGINSSETTNFTAHIADPAGLFSLRSWYDAPDNTTLYTDSACSTPVSADSQEVLCWQNKAQDGNNATVVSGKHGALFRNISSELINGLTVLRFNKTNQTVYETGLDIRAGTTEDVTIFSVYRPRTSNTSDQGQGLWGNDDGSWDRFYYSLFSENAGLGTDGIDDGLISLGGASSGLSIDGAGIVDTIFLLTAIYNGNVSGGVNSGPDNGSEIYFDGELQLSFKDESHATSAQTQMFVGWDGDNGIYDGDLAEVIVYDRILSACELEEVNVYLGDKYGKDFFGVKDNYGHGAPHNNDINGVGEFVSTCTSSKEFTSAASSIATISNPSSLDLSDSLTFAHDDGGFTLIAQAPEDYSARLNQSWRVDRDNDPGNVSISFDLSSTGISTADSTFALVTDTDTDFSNANVHTTGYTVDGSTVSFTQVDFSHGDYFTLVIRRNILIDFVNPTPADQSTTAQDSFTINISSNSSFSNFDHYTFVDFDTSLLGWYRFDDTNASGDPTDLSTYSRNATLESGAVINSTGRFANASHFDGTNDYILLPNSNISYSNGFSACAWVYWNSFDESWSRVFDFGQGQADDNILFAHVGTSTDLRYEVYIGGTSSGSVTASSALATAQWQHLCVSQNSTGNVSLYIDGANVQNGSTTIPAQVERDQMYIGRSAWGSDGYFDGAMDELVFFNRSLSQDEIESMFNATAIQYDSQLTALTDGNHTFIGHAVSQNAQRNQTDQRTVTIDTTVPDVTDLIPTSGTQFNKNTAIEISANVTDNIAVDTVFVNITHPNATVEQLTLTNTLENKYNASYTIPSKTGTFTVTFIANDSLGNSNSSEETTFISTDVFYPGGIASNLTLWLDAGRNGSVFSDSCLGSASAHSDVVACWQDISGNANHFVSSGSQRPAFAARDSDSMNFNPTIVLDGTNDLLNDSDGQSYINGASGFTFISVTKSKIISTDRGFFTTDNVVDDDDDEFAMRYDASGADGGGTNVMKIGLNTTTNPSAKQVESQANIQTIEPQLLAVDWTSGSSIRLFLHAGNTTHTSDEGAISGEVQNSDGVLIGRGTKISNHYWNGSVAEIIYYDVRLNQTARHKVESYLAVKYGITLNETVNYLDSNGTVIYNSTGTHQNYTHGIAGIGRDDTSGLNQTASQSVNDDGIVLMQNASLVANGEFLLWGNDNNSVAEISSNIPSGIETRLNRSWRVSQTGDIGTINVSFNLSGLTVTGTSASDFHLLINASDFDFTNGATIIGASSFSNNIVQFQLVDFSTNDFFTLATSNVSNSDFPIFSNAAVDDTLLGNGDVARFSVDVTDATHNISQVNGTINGASQVFTDGAVDSWFYDFTCSSSDSVVDFTAVAANDTGSPSNTNSTSISGVQTECDAAAPSIGSEVKNSSTVHNDDHIELNATITDAESNLATVIIEGNWTGTLVNYTEGVTNVGSAYSYTVGSGNFSNQEHVGWRYYANDTAGNLQAGTLQTFTVQNRAPGNVSLIEPANASVTADNTTFFNWTAATDADSDSLTYTLHVSNTSDFSTLNIVKQGLTDTNYTLSDSESLANNTYYWRVFTNDTYTTNVSATWQYDIDPNQAISLSFSNALSTSVNWTVLTLPSFNLSANNNNGTDITEYDVAISSTGTNVDVYIKADSNLSTGGGDILGIGNETYSYNTTNSSVPSDVKFNLTFSYADNKIGDNLPSGSLIYLKFYLNVPAGQAAGTYSNNISIKGVPAGQDP